MDPLDPAGSPDRPQGGDAYPWIAPFAERCGRQRVGCAGFDSAASARTDPATGSELLFPSGDKYLSED